jgi:hypothetical protein
MPRAANVPIMHGHSWNRLIVASWAMAASGILACTGALVDVFVPKGSILGQLAWIAVLALVIAGTVTAYVWGCERCESNFDERIDRLIDKANKGKAGRADYSDTRQERKS